MGELVERVDEHDVVLGVVERDEAIRRRWLHRVATSVCRDDAGRFLVHRRPRDDSRFPGQYHWLIGGAVGVGETYAAAAERELEEELGVRARARPLFRFRVDGAIAPYWLGVHEVLLRGPLTPAPSEVCRPTWLTPAQLRHAVARWDFVPDAREVFRRYHEPAGPQAWPST